MIQTFYNSQSLLLASAGTQARLLVVRMLDLHKEKLHASISRKEKIEREIAVTDEKIDEIVYGLMG